MATPKFYELINSAAREAGVPEAVAQAMVDTENMQRDPSLFLKEAWGGGSYGLTMITLRTARSLGFNGQPGELGAPFTNAIYGFRYLRQMYDQVGKGSWSRAVAAYNAGPDLSPWPAAHVTRFEGHLARWQAQLRGAPPSPPRPPILRAGIGGGLLALVILGVLLPLLFPRRRKAQ